MRALCLLFIAACARDPEPALCPPLVAGELVVTEIRGVQSPADELGPWIELYNASGRAIDLTGTKIRFRHRDGSAETAVLVRRALPATPDAFTVLGLFDDTEPPSHVDYGFAGDYRESWLAAAAVDVEACDARIDRVIYDALPRMGTLSLGGAPNADRNDLPAAWCTDDTQIGAAFRGTPQHQNIECR